MIARTARRASRERGMSLVVALIFLVLMAMLGITIAGVTTLQERGASNTRDRDLALQAAEAALRDAEVRLEDAAFRATAFHQLTAANATDANSAAYWENCFVNHVAPCDGGGGALGPFTPATGLPTAGPGAVAAQPEYIVERKPNAGTTKIYRVTTRAVGGQTDTIVVLQAEYGVP